MVSGILTAVGGFATHFIPVIGTPLGGTVDLVALIAVLVGRGLIG